MSQRTKHEIDLNHEDFLPFVRPFISEKTIEDVVSCLRSGWIATGPKGQYLEEKLQNYLEAPYTHLVTSATSGLHLVLLALGVGAGDEVITTPMTFIATLNVIALCGAKPVLVDVEKGTYNIDVSQIESRITPRTKVIMPVHFAGLSVDLDPLYALAKKHGLRVVEDAAHAIGSQYKGKRIGSFGDIQVFSFHPCKNMTTGEGGCIVSRDPELADRIKKMRFHGIDRDAWNRYSKGGSQHFDVVLPGYKCNMSDLQATIGIDQLVQLEEGNKKRQLLVDQYYHDLSGWDELILPEKPPYDHLNSWHIFAPLLNPAKGDRRDDFMAQMKDHNIGTGLHYPAAHLFTYYQQTYGYKRGDFPIAEEIGECVVSLPLFPQMTEKEYKRVIKAMKSIFCKREA